MPTTIKPRGGPKTIFGPKDPPGRSHSLTRAAKQILKRASQRTGASESDVVELLARRHAGELTKADFASV